MTTQMDEHVPLSIVITIVSGVTSLRRCLGALYCQARLVGAEIIVPYDHASVEVTSLASSFPDVRFVEIADELAHNGEGRKEHVEHRLYDRRRAAGLSCARGQIIAMTEDQATPSDDWCESVLASHEEHPDFMVIGGAIENEVDKTMNWARYLCDFGRYGRPFVSGERDYVSDVNVSYKRDAIMSVREVWEGSYHETTVHWELIRKGVKLFLDDRIVVFQHRPQCTFVEAFRERIQWGSIFAETRALRHARLRTYLYAIGTVVLPFVLAVRAMRHARRQRKPNGVVLRAAPAIFVFSVGWSVGEFVGYLTERNVGTNGTLKPLEVSSPVKL